jgi:hypothetical protein
MLTLHHTPIRRWRCRLCFKKNKRHHHPGCQAGALGPPPAVASMICHVPIIQLPMSQLSAFTIRFLWLKSPYDETLYTKLFLQPEEEALRPPLGGFRCSSVCCDEKGGNV